MKTVNIKGKEYIMVQERINFLYQTHPEWSIHTDLIHSTSESCCFKALILDENQIVRSTGYAEEDMVGPINAKCGLENCETSAIGRALANLGLSGSDNRASAEEMAKAITSGRSDTLIEHTKVAREYWHELAQVKLLLSEPTQENIEHAQDIFWQQIPKKPVRMMWFGEEDDITTHERLWIAPTKGGVLETHEKRFLKNLHKEEDVLIDETITNVKMG